MKQLRITETVLRDAHQSLMATRLSTEEMLPILGKMDKAGYFALEVWGGATYDACLRFLNEDPWERLRKIREQVKNTKLQMLLRGQNLLGYKHYPDDIVQKFIQRAIANGIDIIRVFDALNDVRNLETSVKTIKKEGAHCQCAISYATSKVHTLAYYLAKVKELENLGADSICIKDMSGILTPYSAYELIKALKAETKLPLNLHSHCTGGIAEMTYMKAIEAGVDIVDTAISPFATGTSQPATESLALTFKGTNRDPGLGLQVLDEIATYFKPIKDKYLANGILNPKVLQIEPKTINYQVPGGMLSNLLSQLQSLNAADRFEEVLSEVPKVRKDLGFPPLVTPLSQMVGTQAVFNVINGERYKMIPKEIKEYVKGLYGASPAPISKEIIQKIIGDEEIITRRPADLLKAGFEEYKKELQGLSDSEEDILSYALFPQVAKKFLEEKQAGVYYIELSINEQICHKEV